MGDGQHVDVRGAVGTTGYARARRHEELLSGYRAAGDGYRSWKARLYREPRRVRGGQPALEELQIGARRSWLRALQCEGGASWFGLSWGV
mmetsp:Transcript_38458/g.101432  ORF Transcript_38458/g.101432 Transcript_38458/m.101432 type:complete len:90 (-) Transcript_38458:176-445(-)